MVTDGKGSELGSASYADALLAEIQKSAANSGRLYIFLGMCPGVGKTYAMLQAARQRLNEGVDVLAGVVETHGRAETAALLDGMRILPRKHLKHRGFVLEEFDLDAVLAQRPALVLVDELAHTNAHGSRHAKRYQDVLELIGAGIDVYTTLNVQHIESQVDIVRQITGVAVQETVPDSVLDVAHEIQLIDLSVEKLLARMGEGKVYLGERAEQAMSGFFKEGNLTALRELALRFTAEQVDRDLEDIRRLKRVSTPWKANARLMVGVGPSPYAESLIRWTRRAATRIGCPWLVVWVEGSRELSPMEQERLTHSLSLARKLGGEVVSVTGESVPEALLSVARERNVTQIVVGKPEVSRFWRKSLADQIILGSGDIDVCVVRPLAAADRTKPKAPPLHETVSVSVIGEYSWALMAVFTIASICWGVAPFTGYLFSGLVFLLAVVLGALRLHRGPVIFMATLSALCWNYFFIPPQFTLNISRVEDWILFGMFFVVALSMGSLTSRLRMRELAERRRRRQTDAMLRVTQSATLVAEPEKGLSEALRTINELLSAHSALVVRGPEGGLPKEAHQASTFRPSAKEWGVAVWSFENKQCAGRFTDTLPNSAATWFPLQSATAIMGVIGIHLPREARLDFNTRQAIEAFALQLALVLEKEHFVQAIRHAEMVDQSERLQRTLLDSVTHELKTPLAVIQVALEGLVDANNPYVAEIKTATQRLQRVVDSLLQMTRLESGILQPRLDWCDLNDIITAAKQAAGEKLTTHPLLEDIPLNSPLVHADHTLLVQALANVLHNAATYTPPESPIEIHAKLQDGHLRFIVRDHGKGIHDGDEERIFRKFYRAKAAPAGGTGLGLAITKGFLQAQGGAITARNHPEGGAEFVIELKI